MSLHGGSNSIGSQHAAPATPAFDHGRPPGHRLLLVDDDAGLGGGSGSGSCACGCHEVSLRAVARHAVLARVRAFGEREARQRELHEWVVLLVATAVTVMLAAPALVPLVLALQGQRP